MINPRTKVDPGCKVHFSNPSAVAITAMIRRHLKGTEVTLIPSGTRDIFHILGPYGDCMPWMWVKKANSRYFLIERTKSRETMHATDFGDSLCASHLLDTVIQLPKGTK